LSRWLYKLLVGVIVARKYHPECTAVCCVVRESYQVLIIREGRQNRKHFHNHTGEFVGWYDQILPFSPGNSDGGRFAVRGGPENLNLLTPGPPTFSQRKQSTIDNISQELADRPCRNPELSYPSPSSLPRGRIVQGSPVSTSDIEVLQTGNCLGH